MFINLKKKLIDEVKASPSMFQQFANAAQAAVTSSSSTTPSSSTDTTTSMTNENFFSITEEETPQNSPYKPLKLPPGTVARGRGASTSQSQSLNNGTGAIPRTRKLSNSSVASDVSFRLPSYDSPALYHMQSDLDMSGSEMDDTASTTKLDIITKEQLYAAYKKSLDRYHKYRCRYTDLAKKFKDLESDSSKARSVLVETQEKAIRRINELREQCALEQQAKAHLEEALRMEMDDMQCKVKTYQTKLQLLGGDSVTDATGAATGDKITSLSLIDLRGAGVATAAAKEANNLINLEEGATHNEAGQGESQLSRLQRTLQERDTELSALNEKWAKASARLESLQRQEEENALHLAQEKQAIHVELESKENEVKRLSASLKQMQHDLQAATKRETQLNAQLGELKELREKAKQLQTAKQEADARTIAAEHMLAELREQTAARQRVSVAAEQQQQQLATLAKESEQQKLQDLRQRNAQLNEMVQRYQQNEVSLAEIDNELNRTKNDNDNLRSSLADSERRTQELLQQLAEENGRASAAALAKHAADMEQLSAQLQDALAAGEVHATKVRQLETQLGILSQQNASDESATLAALKEELNRVQGELGAQISAARDQLSTKERELKTATNKLAKTKKHHETQQSRAKEQSEEVEKLTAELSGREEQLRALQLEAREREERADGEKAELTAQVANILHEIAHMEEQLRVVQQSHAELEGEKQQLEAKIEAQQRLSSDADANTLRQCEQRAQLEEQLRQAEAKLQLVESENSQLAERNCLLAESANRLEKLGASEEATASEMRLKLEMAEDAVQKLNEKMAQVLDENSRLHNAQELSDHDQRTLQDKCDLLEKEKLVAEDARQCAAVELAQANVGRAAAEAKQQELLEQMQRTKDEWGEEGDQLMQRLAQMAQNQRQLEDEATALRAQLELFNSTDGWKDGDDDANGLAAHLKDLLEALRKHNAALRSKIRRNKRSQRAKADAHAKQLRRARRQAHQLREQLECDGLEYAQQIEALEGRLRTATGDVERLHESNDSFQVLNDQLQSQHRQRVEELEGTLKQLQSKVTDVGKLADYEQLRIESEYLNKHARQLEGNLAEQQQANAAQSEENAELRERLKSMQCELYVLGDNATQHAVQLAEKQSALAASADELRAQRELLDSERIEMRRQAEHAQYITEQNDAVQKELLQTQQQLAELQQQLSTAGQTLRATSDDCEAKEQRLSSLRDDLERNNQTVETLMKELSDLNELRAKERLASNEAMAMATATSAATATVAAAAKSSAPHDAEHLRQINETLQRELEELKCKSSTEITILKDEIEDMQGNATEMAARIMELERVRAGAKSSSVAVDRGTALQPQPQQPQVDRVQQDGKLKEIMNEVQEVSNRNLFLEQKCENFLILEQSNERLKLQNAKLSRQLDETLVSLQHNEGITANTEFEYLKNIMFQYLTGTASGNNETLVKVISAVLKFSPQQTQVALEKEHQRRSLINKIL